MPPFGPISRRELIRALRAADFDGPYSGGKHPFMLKGDVALTVPNVHQGDIGRELLGEFLSRRAFHGRNGKDLAEGANGGNHRFFAVAAFGPSYRPAATASIGRCSMRIFRSAD